MGWSTLGDLCINDGKLLGCSFYRNSVGIWVADVSVFSFDLSLSHCIIVSSSRLLRQNLLYESFFPLALTCFLLGYQHVEPYGIGAPEPDQSICTEVKFNSPGSHSLEKVGIIGRSTSGFRSTSPDCETKDIKTIYVDCKFFSFSFYFLVYCLLDISLLYLLLYKCINPPLDPFLRNIF